MRAPFPRPDLPLGLGLGLSTVAMGNPRWVSEVSIRGGGDKGSDGAEEAKQHHVPVQRKQRNG